MNNLVCFNEAVSKIEQISNSISNDLGYKSNVYSIDKIESNLDVSDYCFTLLFGMMGALLSTNARLEKYLADIHRVASDVNGEYDVFQQLVGKLLHHKNDHIDSLGSQMMNREGTLAEVAFHRLLWGHDVLSKHSDNPFKLMISQKGSKFFGILQAFRHLLADTMSKQGLPMPGSSYLDLKNDNGKTTNHLIELSRKLSLESYEHKGMAQEMYSHMFTIRAQDIVGGVLVKVLTEVYCKIRGIENKLRKAQITFMSYAISFFGEAIIGTIKQKGVPYINVPVGGAMMVSFIKFCYLDAKETRELIEKTNELAQINEDIILKYEIHEEFINNLTSSVEFAKHTDNVEKNFDTLIDFLNEDNL